MRIKICCTPITVGNEGKPIWQRRMNMLRELYRKLPKERLYSEGDGYRIR